MTAADRDWLIRVGEGNASRGLRRAILYAKAVRHDLNNVRQDLTLQAQLLKELGHATVAEMLLRLDGKLGAIMVKGDAAVEGA